MMVGLKMWTLKYDEMLDKVLSDIQAAIDWGENHRKVKDEVRKLVVLFVFNLAKAIEEDYYSKMTEQDIMKRLDELYEAIEECKPKKCEPVYTTGPSHMDFVFEKPLDDLESEYMKKFVREMKSRGIEVVIKEKENEG